MRMTDNNYVRCSTFFNRIRVLVLVVVKMLTTQPWYSTIARICFWFVVIASTDFDFSRMSRYLLGKLASVSFYWFSTSCG